MIVEQFLPALHDGDAVGGSTLALHRFLSERSIDSRIVAMTIDPSLADAATPFADYRETAGAIKILHFAIPSPLTDFFERVAGPRVMIYHNVTPPEFFADFSPDLTRFVAGGRDHLRRLAGHFDLCLADSGYNADELRALGYGQVEVFPIQLDLDRYAAPPCADFLRLIRDDRRNIVFIGRVSPNKRIEDLVKVLFFYKKFLSPAVRLIVAGNTRTLPSYFLAVRDLASRFLLTADDLLFTHHLPFAELLAVYHSADLFLSMSEHEGFCLPLIESMALDVPVLAFAAGAVPETLGGAGILFHDKAPDRVAALAEQIIETPALAESLRRRGRERIVRYRQEADPARLLPLLERL